MDRVGDTMSIKKCVNSSFVDYMYRKYGTETDIITNLPQEIITDGQPIGRNLYNNAETTWIHGYVDNSGNIVTGGDQQFTSNFTAVEAETDYNLSGTVGSHRIYYYDANKGFMSRSAGMTANVQNFTTPQNCKFIQMQCPYGNSADDWMLVKGSTALPYQPYAPTIIKGNLSQSSTPSPSSPIIPSECGDKTENLLNSNNFTLNFWISSNGDITSNTAGAINYNKIAVSEGDVYTSKRYVNIPGAGFAFAFYDSSDTFIRREYSTNSEFSVTAQSGDAYFITAVSISSITQEKINQSQIMLNSGSTALPFEPYGYKIPILSGGTTTPVYLGEVQSTRNIQKLVLTGQENWTLNNSGTTNAYLSLSTGVAVMGSTEQLCTHYQYNTITSTNTNKGLYMIQTGVLRVREEEPTQSDKTTFESFLQTQYTNGTPVTVWYVLSESTTGIVNEPLRKLGNYADSVSVTGIPTTGTPEQFDIDTDLKPSEVDLTYHGWHNHNDTEFTE